MRGSWLLLALVGVPMAAKAEAPDFILARLETRRDPGSESCMSDAELEQAVESRLGRRVFTGGSDADAVVEAELGRSGEAWTAKLVLRGRDGRGLGTRELSTEAEHCSSLDDSLALTLVLMLDVPREELPEPEPAPTAAPAAPAAPRRPPPTTPVRLPKDTPARRAPWAWQVGAFGVLGLGVLPGVSPGIRLGGGVQPPALFMFELDATLWPSQAAEEAGGGVRVGGWSVGFLLCPLAWKPEPWRFEGCVGQEVGWLEAEGFGYDETESATRLTYGLGPRGRGALGLAGPLALRFGVGVQAVLVRDRFVYRRADGTDTGLHRAAPVAGVAELGLGLIP